MNDKQPAYIEARAGAGGLEASIWAKELLRMYTRFANKHNWKVFVMDELVIKIKGDGVFSKLKNEAGVHRVQRVPKTEKRGRVHTSTATIAVLPEVKENEIQIKASDLEWQFYRASSQGGQNVQKVSSAVRLIHKPSGIVVTSQRERFQEANRQIALEHLRAKLWAAQEQEKLTTIAGYRSAIGRGFRNEKIRTYNFPQSRITDHRLRKSWQNLEDIINGNLDKIIKATATLQ